VTVTQPELPAIDWTDLCGTEPAAPADTKPAHPKLHDLIGQGLTALQIHTMTDIQPSPEYL
jgi:hypothetical protein